MGLAEQDVDAARHDDGGAQWTNLKDAGHDLTYWQQNDQGKWEKKD